MLFIKISFDFYIVKIKEFREEEYKMSIVWYIGLKWIDYCFIWYLVDYKDEFK